MEFEHIEVKRQTALHKNFVCAVMMLLLRKASCNLTWQERPKTHTVLPSVDPNPHPSYRGRGPAGTLCCHSHRWAGGWEPWTPPPIPQKSGGLVRSHCVTFLTEHDPLGGWGGQGSLEHIYSNTYTYIYIHPNWQRQGPKSCTPAKQGYIYIYTHGIYNLIGGSPTGQCSFRRNQPAGLFGVQLLETLRGSPLSWVAPPPTNQPGSHYLTSLTKALLRGS